ncbi:hypothetical protein CYMTET_10974 [Cymbomonas tetramitiformis]|uniref:Ribosome-recycling factor, chloroplastic n=1 Tax=Cymbomonas tetramitiformis TaxID=36881 RepID=A0AAE0LDM3_9CHLO|nr:hypothetical protein CYMTET_10974 [Cymbomonas tetramitiformis]
MAAAWLGLVQNAAAVQKALITSALSLNPFVEGDVILVPIPALNSDTKKEICKMVARAGEEAKKSIRTHRKKAMDLLKKAEKAGTSEDVVKREEKQVQNIIDERTKAVDAICNKKHKAVMEAS